MGKIEEILEKIGLTNQESRVYLKLLQLQEGKTGLICEKTGIASSNIYKILNSLIDKGLVSYRMQNNVKVFSASPPETLSELFKEKEEQIKKERQEVQELIKNLKKTPVIEEPQSKYKYYEGISGVKGMWYEINSSLSKNSDEVIYATKKGAFEVMLGLYEEHHKIKNKLGAKAKIIIPPSLEKLGKRRENKNTKVKYMELKNEAEWGVVDDMVYIQYIITKNPRAFLIKDKIFAETFKDVFEKLWKGAK